MADTDLSGTVIDGRYKVIEPIADGAMGSVYRGERVGLGRAVAIKIMHQELPDELASRQRFEREAKLMALLEHPNCVSVMDFGLHEDKPFLVMDLVRGTSLLQILDKVGRIEPAKACDILKQVLSGLAHAHELGIVHRDIKPANIMISEKAGLGQQVRILDFGLARLTESSTKLTTGIVVGTPNYMAPEQCKGGDIDARTDLYACAVMLFEMLTGRKPFIAEDPIQVVRKHLMERPPTMASVEPNIDFGELEAVVATALSKAPADRFANAVEMAKAIDVAAAKASKMSAAALFSRAVPDGGAPIGNQQATMSGWSVPEGGAPSPGTQMLSDSAILPDSAVMAPVSGAMPSGPHAEATVAAPPPPHMPPPPPPSGLPPLPQAAPYVPPPSFSTGPAPLVPRPPSPSGPAPLVPQPSSSGPASGAISSGAPYRSMSVPPTRPSAAGTGPRSAIAKLPFSKQQLMIGAGALVALIVILVIALSGGDDKKKKPTTTKTGTGLTQPDEPKSDPVPEVVERATALIASEDYDDAVAVLKRARKANPDDAQLAFLSGKANFGRLWWEDGIDDFRDAIRIDGSYKENDDLLKTVLKGFLTTPDVDDRIVEFMRHDIGPPMRPYLEETAEKHPNKQRRARARAELNARP